jgi:hypothetical protein
MDQTKTYFQDLAFLSHVSLTGVTMMELRYIHWCDSWGSRVSGCRHVVMYVSVALSDLA